MCRKARRAMVPSRNLHEEGRKEGGRWSRRLASSTGLGPMQGILSVAVVPEKAPATFLPSLPKCNGA